MRKWRRKGTLGALQAWEYEVGEAPAIVTLPGEMASLSLAATNVMTRWYNSDVTAYSLFL